MPKVRWVLILNFNLEHQLTGISSPSEKKNKTLLLSCEKYSYDKYSTSWLLLMRGKIVFGLHCLLTRVVYPLTTSKILISPLSNFIG